MRTFTLEISKPKDAEDFEDYCVEIYSVVFEDPTPKKNGRSGQSQGGVDIFVEPRSGGRKGIQCKRYYETKITESLVNDEVKAADEAGWKINELIVATTTPSDSKLVKYVQDLSDSRAETGKFKVSIEFWNDICNHINRYSILQQKYSPNAPGGVFDVIRTSTQVAGASAVAAAEGVIALTAKFDSFVSQAGGSSFVASLSTNGNSVISRQLDKIVEFVKGMGFASAKALLSVVFEEFSNLDAHQQARWYLLSGIVDWHTGDASSAVRKFDTAYNTYPEDDRICAGKIRGLLLANHADQAFEIAERAVSRFPDSIQVWLAWANTKIKLAQYLVEADLPSKFQADADALQMMAVNFHDAGDQALSLAYADRALRAEGAGFYTWSNVLFIATGFAGKVPFLASLELLPTEVRRTLSEACGRFEPREEKLWRVEGSPIVGDVAVNLAVGRLLLGDASACLAICDEAEAHGDSSTNFTVPRVYAFHALNDHQHVVDVGAPHLADMHISAQMMVAEAAAILGRADLVGQVAALPSVASDLEAKGTLQALTWVALRSKGDIAALTASLDAYDFESEATLVVLNTAARMYQSIGKAEKAATIGAKIATMVTAASATPLKIQAADTFAVLKDYPAAIARLVSIPGIEHSRELQTRLLDAYAKGGYRAKARTIVDGAPPSWFDDEAFVGTAIFAAQQANDWPRLEPLALRHRDSCPTSAHAWDFWFQVALRTLRPAELRRAFSEAPLELSGAPQVVRRVALAELQYGDAALGIRRLYRLFRSNLNDANVAAGYITALLAAEGSLLGAVPASISAGVAATLHREDGSSFTLVVDPADVGALPEAQNYYPRDAVFAANFIGKAVGDTVTIADPMGEDTTYRVVSLVPASRHLLVYAHELIEKSVEPISGFISVSVEDSDGNVDLSGIHTQLKRVTERANLVLDGYRQGRLTVGLCAQLLGRSPVEVLLGWGRRQPPLVVAEGGADNHAAWLSSLASSSSCVLDCITLVELGLFKALPVLGLLPHPIVAQSAYDLLKNALEEAKNERTLGHTSEVDGQLSMVRYTPEFRRSKVELLTSIIECVERHCEIAPAYGPEEVSSNFLQFKGVLDDESYDAIALCLERGAELISLDARFRALALSGFEVSAVPPLAAIAHAVAKGQLSHAEQRQYQMQMLVSNRTYVSIGALDFLWMLSQAGWATSVLDAWTEVLSSAGTLFDSAVRAVCGVFEVLHLLDIQFGVVHCLVERLCLAIYRHPSFHPVAAEMMQGALVRYAASVYLGPPWHPTFTEVQGERARELLFLVEDAMSRAKEIAEGRAVATEHGLNSLYCERRPFLSEK